MSPLEERLDRLGSRINRWRAFETGLLGSAAVLACWAGLALADLWLRPRQLGRLVLSGLLVAAAVVVVFLLARILKRSRTPAAVAALLERHFPQLDNHLINRVLFAAAPERNSPWLRAYLGESGPDWTALPLDELKDRRLRRYGAGALAVALLLLVLPGLRYGNAWGVALQRVANPFSRLAPTTFAAVTAVAPGHATVIQGEPVELLLRARGRAGHSVMLELFPADDARSVIRLGTFDTTGAEQTFVHTISRLTVPVGYRFTAGDAWPTERFTLTPVPPLAVEGLSVNVVPPAYTRLPPRTVDALAAIPEIPVHAQVTFVRTLNRAAQRVVLVAGEEPPVALSPAAEGRQWRGSLVVDKEVVFRLTAHDTAGGHRLEQTLPMVLLVDRPPDIRVTVPAARTALPPGGRPQIAFEASDDYGLDRVVLEKVRRGARPQDPGEPLTQWSADGGVAIRGEWSGTPEDLAGGAAFRLVAEDCMVPGPPNRTVSPPIIFDSVLATEQFRQEVEVKEKLRKGLGQLVVRQRANLRATAALHSSLPVFDPASWDVRLAEQRGIRNDAIELLASGGTLLGGARVVIERVREPMAEAVTQLVRLRAVPPENREAAATAALETQKLILRLLTLADERAATGGAGTEQSGLLAMVDALLKGQTDTRAATDRAAQRAAVAAEGKTAEDEETATVLEALAGRQQALALDMAELIELARRDAGMARDGDPLQTLMTTFADTAENLRVRSDMLRAAQALVKAAPAQALAPQAGATNSLHALRQLLAGWQAAENETRTEEALDVIRDAREAVNKLEKLQEAIVDALRATETQGNKTDGQKDDELTDEIVELKAQMAEAMLKVATDLQALPDLDAANELVVDCYQIYEAMAQVAGSEKNTEAQELGLQKEDFYLEMMAKTGQKLDEMEHWLPNKPDDIKRNIESFDQAEVQSAIPVIGMPEELQDLIGDLLEEQEELAKNTDDSLTNQGDANPALGWEIAEGETVSYSAGGKSGNRRPDHKDQDGRSQVGRAGMADGEVMAKSGRINEGDEEIDKRRTRDSTQSGYVEEEDHAEAKATGGGKNSGYSDTKGMAGTAADERRQSKVQQAPEQARQADLARMADAVYAQAQLNGLRIPAGFNHAREKMNRAAEAGRAGNIRQMREFQQRAIQDLILAQANLDAGVSGVSMGAGGDDYRPPDAGVASTPDEAPAGFRELVSDYFKAIGEFR